MRDLMYLGVVCDLMNWELCVT